MLKTVRNVALVTGMLVASAGLAAAQSGPVDGKGQAGGAAHRGMTSYSVGEGVGTPPEQRMTMYSGAGSSMESTAGSSGYVEQAPAGSSADMDQPSAPPQARY